MTVFLVRHAKAGSRERWEAPDRDRPLTKAGWRQAQGLVEQLARDPVSRVVSSPYIRCVQTVEPLATARGLQVELDDRLAEGADPGAALRLITAGDGAVLCSHADVVGAVVLTVAEQGARLRSEPRWDKGSTWAFEVAGGRVAAGRYLPPPG